MAQMEEALQSILGNQQAMEQIMALANSLSGENIPVQDDGMVDAGEVSSGTFEPERLQRLIPEEDRDLILLRAVSPFLKPERQEKLAQALELVQMLRMFRSAFGREQERAPE